MEKINLKELNEKIKEFITDDNLILYFGKNFRQHIIKYGDLDNYDSVQQLLPKDKSFIIILIEFQKNIGH